VDREEWLFLLRGETGTTAGCSDELCPTWLQPKSNEWKLLQGLSKLSRFEGLIEDLNQEYWQDFFCSSYSHTLPGSWQERLGPYRSLLVLRSLRLDMVMDAVEDLIEDQLNFKREDRAEFSVENAYEESTTETPITCIFKGVVTPLDEVMTCAKRRNMLKRLWVFSLEQCKGPKILEAIKEAATWGKWVLLHNCHTNTPWINSALRMALNDVKTRQIHDSFRLWLTTESMPGPPPYLLADSVKIVVEPAKGVKCKMVQILKFEKADEFYHVNNNGAKHSEKLFQLALFHSVVQERANFGAIGWNVPVELDHTVFNLAKVELCKLNESSAVSMEKPLTLQDLNHYKSKEKAREKNRIICLQYMITKVVYGGYITDDRGENLMHELFQHGFTSSIFRTSVPENRHYVYLCSHLRQRRALVKQQVPWNELHEQKYDKSLSR
jgi:dynein heavy chain